MRIEWKEEYTLGIPNIDEQHKHFVNIINSLYEAIINNEDQKKLATIFEDINTYTTLHFQTEEKYFNEFHYEDAEMHIKKHSDFKEKIKEFEDAHEKGEIKISTLLIDFLEDWLVRHLETIDKKYVPCFKEHGL